MEARGHASACLPDNHRCRRTRWARVARLTRRTCRICVGTMSTTNAAHSASFTRAMPPAGISPRPSWSSQAGTPECTWQQVEITRYRHYDERLFTVNRAACYLSHYYATCNRAPHTHEVRRPPCPHPSSEKASPSCCSFCSMVSSPLPRCRWSLHANRASKRKPHAATGGGRSGPAAS